MIYLDNAATSHYKPKSVTQALLNDVKHSANSGRSSHDLAIKATMRIENARCYLAEKYGENGCRVIFTKNCTEALNLAIFGYLTHGMKVVTTAFEHNGVLRPLHFLSNKNEISLDVVTPTDGRIDETELLSRAKRADLVVLNAVSNVTGTVMDVKRIARELDNNTKLLVDGAQAIPYVDLSLAEGVDMLAVPAHKGLHGVQGVGFLVCKGDVKLRPRILGGTGTNTFDLYPPYSNDVFESGTQFSGGISALHAGAIWTYKNLSQIKLHLKSLSTECAYCLKHVGATVYSTDHQTGLVAFNVGNVDSNVIGDALADNGFAVRSGYHCAPLVHEYLKTQKQGIVRVSFGVDNTQSDLTKLVGFLENVTREYHDGKTIYR